ncbi:MAG: phosphate signaling complex protein PhoU [Nitrospirae bacterium]|nr:phosphate signaling complex protein PhoU [Nitrospirota bacterium]
MIRSRELAKLRDMLIRMGVLVEASIKDSVRSLVNRDSELARRVIDHDHEINSLDVQIDEECIKVLALTQPMASDLRFITTALKITADLERIGDNSVNIAERALELNTEPLLKPYVDIPHMGSIAQGMVRDAIDAFVNGDKKLALDVIMRDDEVDDLNEIVFQELTAIMTRDSSTVRRAVKISYVSKYLERIADHATNIAEMVVYLIEGKIIRHTEIHREGRKSFDGVLPQTE